MLFPKQRKAAQTERCGGKTDGKQPARSITGGRGVRGGKDHAEHTVTPQCREDELAAFKAGGDILAVEKHGLRAAAGGQGDFRGDGFREFQRGGLRAERAVYPDAAAAAELDAQGICAGNVRRQGGSPREGAESERRKQQQKQQRAESV